MICRRINIGSFYIGTEAIITTRHQHLTLEREGNMCDETQLPLPLPPPKDELPFEATSPPKAEETEGGDS